MLMMVSICSHTCGSFHANSTNLEESSTGTISDFAQNCTEFASIGAMKNPQVSDQNYKRFRFYGLLNCKVHNPVQKAMKSKLLGILV